MNLWRMGGWDKNEINDQFCKSFIIIILCACSNWNCKINIILNKMKVKKESKGGNE